MLDSRDRVFAGSGFGRDQTTKAFKVSRFIYAYEDITGKRTKAERSEVKNNKEKRKQNSQALQGGLNIREFEEDGPVRDLLIVEHKADTPDNRREADVLGAGQVVQNNLGLALGCHVALCYNEDSTEDIKGNCRVPTGPTCV